MANIALRSPQFKYINIPLASNGKSAKCVINIDGSQRYVITKNSQRGRTLNFDISELCRDYLDITYDSFFVPQTVDITTTLSVWDGLNATGNPATSSGTPIPNVVFQDTGFEAYGSYEDGANPELPDNTILISKSVTNAVINRVTSTGGTLESTQCLVPLGVSFDSVNTSNRVTILYPSEASYAGASGIVATMTAGVAGTQIFNQGATTIFGYPDSVIARVNCTKYGNGNEITFINKFGVQQVLWFFLKKNKSMSRKNEGYKANTLTYPNTNNPATYSVQNAPNKVFNTTAKQTHKLSSGYYPEGLNAYFEQLLLSEYVWLKLESSNVRIPVNVKTSSMDFKTSVNDRLIEYTIDFEEAFNHINNIR